jgi:hypothetical protein
MTTTNTELVELAEREFALARAELKRSRTEIKPFQDRLDAAIKRSNAAFDAVVDAKKRAALNAGVEEG